MHTYGRTYTYVRSEYAPLYPLPLLAYRPLAYRLVAALDMEVDVIDTCDELGKPWQTMSAELVLAAPQSVARAAVCIQTLPLYRDDDVKSASAWWCVRRCQVTLRSLLDLSAALAPLTIGFWWETAAFLRSGYSLAFEWISSYLAGRSQFDRFNGTAMHHTRCVRVYTASVRSWPSYVPVIGCAAGVTISFRTVIPLLTPTLMARIADCITHIIIGL